MPVRVVDVGQEWPTYNEEVGQEWPTYNRINKPVSEGPYRILGFCVGLLIQSSGVSSEGGRLFVIKGRAEVIS
ncbi:hypothetical protein RISK_005198 [Rhodopirellula islandica]|uniref:Uncharacterized protein n=1 Tax=Rhodopirellula islandica TaxID=595434 RepID=A0A0J1B867_RHOIS|nr:hypothetical protein [Rhodopirellula islandica]KLU02902.1 hypothetical protein RISK_005198 [Rhodopirellula islandica]